MFSKIIYGVCICIFMSSVGLAQKDSSFQGNDSLRNVFLMKQARQLHELERARQEDSLKRLDLEKQISLLSTTDNVKKQELQKELDEMKNAEVARIVVKRKKIDSLRTFVKGYSVAPFFKDSLFVIYNRLGSLSASGRAELVTVRIKSLASNYFFHADSLKVVPGETTADIVFGGTMIMSISEDDALWQNSSKENLAWQYKNIIAQAILKYQAATNWKTITKEVGFAILVLSVLGILIFFISKFFRIARKKIASQKGKLIRGVKIRNYEILDANRQTGFFLTINNFLKLMAIITVVYI
jgi:hypothetical protein